MMRRLRDRWAAARRGLGRTATRLVRAVARELGVSGFCALAGAGAIVRGVWLIYRPAGWIVAGVLGLAFALLAAHEEKPR